MLQDRGVFFDMDGVILDTDSLWRHVIMSIQSRFRLDLSVLEESDGFSLSTEDAVRTVLESMGRFSEETLAGIVREADRIYASSFARLARLEDGMPELLTRLKDMGVRLALVSNSSAWQVDMAVSHFRLEGLFCATVSADDVSHPKPSPEPYLKALELTGLDACQAVAVEDSMTGIRAASEASMRCIMVGPDPVDFSPGPSRVPRRLLGRSLERMLLADTLAASGTDI